MSIFFIEKDKLLFRTAYIDNVVPLRATFYALKPSIAGEYLKNPGESLYTLRAKENIYLLDMRKISTFKKVFEFLHQNNYNRIYWALRTSFFNGMDSIADDHLDHFHRVSSYEIDRIYADALCAFRYYLQLHLHVKKMDGFIFPKMNHFHSEVIICNPKDCLSIYPLDPATVRQIQRLERKDSLVGLDKKYKTITAGEQRQLKIRPFTTIPSDSFVSVMNDAININTRIISRTNGSSYILLSTYYLGDVKFAMVQKVSRYNYKKMEQLSLDQQSAKSILDSLLLEYINGLWINDFCSKNKNSWNYFIVTYFISFAKRNERNRQIFRQIEQNDSLDFSYLDLGLIDFTKYSYRDACKLYKDSLFTVLYLQYVPDGRTFHDFLTSDKMTKKDKFVLTLKILIILYGYLYFLTQYKFTHNAFNYNNIMLQDRRIVHSTTGLIVEYCPVIVDYSRCSTPWSYRFLNQKLADPKTRIQCESTRTTRFKNSFNPSIDLFLLHQIRTAFETIDTSSQNDVIKYCKMEFLALLRGIPPAEYFDQVMDMPQRPTFQEWRASVGYQGECKIPTVKEASDRLVLLIPFLKSITQE